MEKFGGYINKSNKLLRLFLFFLLIPFVTLAKPVLNLNDTIVNRGIISQIPIYGSFTETNTSNLEIVLEFDAILLDIKSVTGGDDFVMKCSEPELEINMDNVSQSSVTISCDNIQQIDNGIFCIINVEGLAGPDSITQIKPIKITVNGQDIVDTELRTGQITIPGTPVFQTYPENIGNNYPNPFFEETRFPISIHEPTNVKFYIYTNDGRFILSNEKQNDMLILSFYKNKTEIPISNLNDKLERGFYILKLSPDNMRFASGEYYLIMVTKLGVYYKNFMYFK